MARQNITSAVYGVTWVLVDKSTQQPIKVGQQCEDFRGETDTLVGGRAPHKEGSAGFVWTKDGAEYYASVYGCEWVRA